MSTDRQHDDGGNAFPETFNASGPNGTIQYDIYAGMTVWDVYFGQAIANPAVWELAVGATESDIERMLPGRHRVGRSEIAASYAASIADAMVAERAKRRART